MKYTDYKLTEHQLKFLSQIVNNRQRNFFSTTLDILEKHGLIGKPINSDGDYFATDAGVTALSQARKEGW